MWPNIYSIITLSNVIGSWNLGLDSLNFNYMLSPLGSWTRATIALEKKWALKGATSLWEVPFNGTQSLFEECGHYSSSRMNSDTIKN